MGSVTPVRNEVNAIENSMPPHGLALFRRGGAVHGQAGARQAEHHHREESRHERAGAGIAGEEALQVAGDAVVVA